MSSANRSDSLGSQRPRVELTRYDLVLAVFPSALLFAMVVGNLLSLSFPETMAIWGGIGMLALLDGLFLSPPE